MYSFSRFVSRAFLFALSISAFNVIAAPVVTNIDVSTKSSETLLQDSIKVLRGEDSGLSAAQALGYLESVEGAENRMLRNQALLWLGRAYRDGLGGTAKDVRRAFQYFELAAGKEGGDPVARFELAQSYYQGVGTDRNLIAAYMWVSLSLHQQTDVSVPAKTLQETVAGLLNKDQLATAEILISQMENLYLNK